MSYLFTGLLVLGVLIYGGFTLVIIRGLTRKQHNPGNENTPAVAVIIAARNEASHLPALLEDLALQDYAGKLDIYIADDRSEDETWSILNKFSRTRTNFHPVRIQSKSQTMTPKKHALTMCIKQTTAEIIVSTDADCRVGPGWVRSAVARLGEDVGVIVGFSRVDGKNIFSKYQALDFIGIMAANAGMMQEGYFWSGSGQNLAYRRSAFTDIGGFTPVADRLSGDDVYLVQTIPRITGLRAQFNFDEEHFVTTAPVDTLGQFLSQRMRWASNSSGLHKSDPLFFSFLLAAFVTNLMLLLHVPIFGMSPIFFAAAGIKFLLEGGVLVAAWRRFRYGSLLWLFPLWFIVQPIYIPFIGIAGLRGRFTWKS